MHTKSGHRRNQDTVFNNQDSPARCPDWGRYVPQMVKQRVFLRFLPKRFLYVLEFVSGIAGEWDQYPHRQEEVDADKLLDRLLFLKHFGRTFY